MFEYVNKIKLQRAIASLPKDASDAEIREVYLKMGGLIVGGESTPEMPVKAADESTVENVIKTVKKAVKKKK